MHHPAGTINRVPKGEQDNQDDKKLPRRCLHALASLAGAGIRVKPCGQHVSGNLQQCGSASAHLFENRGLRPARNSCISHASTASSASTEALSPNVLLMWAKRSTLPGPKIKLPP